ncbi:HEAT repeat-containing protein [Pseudarcicella hirudinis]|uniref:HEAT repeat-containing protein n=1 Tax=Pseudarcicella hirudinis TaxID=1079859 RepID=A0A1I5YMU7_9BACT|nr:HEAT repeat domain-containing protein [Pseudarcicella hirudinis]SFQ45503.1 HEAT repeat-containing protein [Pseudarcicella hirudinis]
MYKASLMKCEYDKERLIYLLNNPINETERTALEKHIEGCPDCQNEFEASQKIWTLLGEIPQPAPSDHIQADFRKMLANYKETVTEKHNFIESLLAKFKQLWTLQPSLQLAYSIVLLVTGLFAGYFINHSKEPVLNGEISALSMEVQDMKKMMMMSLLENPSASERMRAISYSEEITDVNSQVIEALLTTLNNDENVNVRLMTLEALVKLSGNPMVREGLVQSITRQESPLVQSAIADVMVKLQEKKSIKPLQKLLRKNDLNEMVKDKIRQSLNKLI